MNNLISNQNDGTFTNIENPITSFANYGQQMIDTAKKDVQEQIDVKKRAEKAAEEGANILEITKYLQGVKEEKINEILYGDKPSEEDLLNQTLKWAEEQQAKEWERENEIRKETQEREDSALQRWVEDARKAGINPNIFSGQGAASGGGITSATGLNMTQYETVANRLLTEWETMVNQEFEKEENKKDRINNIMRGLINLAGLGIFAGKTK